MNVVVSCVGAAAHSIVHVTSLQAPIGVLLPGAAQTELLDSPVTMEFRQDHTRRCLSGCPQSFLVAAEINECDVTVTVDCDVTVTVDCDVTVTADGGDLVHC